MSNTYQIIIILFCLTIGTLNARADITDTFSRLVQRNLTYRVINGYEDIDKYLPGETASVYYSLWECLVRNFSDHSTPVIFYLSGGPGLSSQHAAYREFGPIEI
jgi:carboxypeptidase C (cathepsin A)